jgi:hypothetical protein
MSCFARLVLAFLSFAKVEFPCQHIHW